MKFVLRFVLALFSGLTLGGMTIKEKNTQFIYLNNPETLKTTGILHQKKYSQNTNVRYFFHFKNGTKSIQNFHINSKFIIKDSKISYSTHLRPEIAGQESTHNFMKLQKKHQQINVKVSLKPNETVSGMLEGDIFQNDIIEFSFGNNIKAISTKEFHQSKYNIDFSYDLNVDKSLKYRLGDTIKNIIAGQYGNNIILNIKPKQSGILKLSFSPRGGDGLLVFENRGKIYKTKIFEAYKNVEVILLDVDKDKIENFIFIPSGGLNYPIELSFTLQTEILKEAFK